MCRFYLDSGNRSWLLYLPLLLPSTVTADQSLTITLTPRDYEDPRLAETFVCGVSPSLDTGRLIAELNPAFIFKFLDQGAQSDPYYQTQVFDVVIFTRDESPKEMKRKWLDDEKDQGLYSLLVVPAKLQCNSEVFNDAEEAGSGYYPVFVTSKIDEFIPAILTFISEAETMKRSWGGSLPKLCGIKIAMEKDTAVSREYTLISLFNFMFNENKRAMESTDWKVCATPEETIDAFVKSKLFDIDFEPSFKKDTERFLESAGSALSTIVKGDSKNKKALCYVETEFSQGGGNINPATEEDIVGYNGPIVFMENENTSRLFVDIKKDNITEPDEIFFLRLKTMSEVKSNRKKRHYRAKQIVVFGEPTFRCDDITPCQHKHQTCHKGKCVECVNSDHCKDPMSSVCNTKVNICSLCYEGEGCPDVRNAKCNDNFDEHSVGSRCIPCKKNKDCTLNIVMNDKLRGCNEGHCVECTTDEHCKDLNRNNGCNTKTNTCTLVRPLTKILDLQKHEDLRIHERLTWMRKYATVCYEHYHSHIDWNLHTNAEVGYIAYENSKSLLTNTQFETKFDPNSDLDNKCAAFSANVKLDKTVHAETQLMEKAVIIMKKDQEIDTIYIISWMSPCNKCKQETMRFAYKDFVGKTLNVGWMTWYKQTDEDMQSWCVNVNKAKKSFLESPAYGGTTLNYYPLKKALYNDVIPNEC